jgi:hypothetical protein
VPEMKNHLSTVKNEIMLDLTGNMLYTIRNVDLLAGSIGAGGSLFSRGID